MLGSRLGHAEYRSLPPLSDCLIPNASANAMRPGVPQNQDNLHEVEFLALMDDWCYTLEANVTWGKPL